MKEGYLIFDLNEQKGKFIFFIIKGEIFISNKKETSFNSTKTINNVNILYFF